ncbi:uncharacterized protein LOC133523782 [Cydia pomonella]|uniref:uncharacterized protein LOC133523782 n=1 Tax=Cydia pomonella TaxID=82600 RepID=UPI002ADE7FD8|nr:uncharacterized protein LOC133523782 [Cydia pomonella]
MEIDSETENDILRDLARLQLSKFESSADESVLPGEDMNKEHTEPLSWTNPPSREARELIVAEEILRFATITERPFTSLSTRAIQAAPELISVTPSNTTKKINEATAHLTSEVANGDEMPAVNQAPSRSTRIASDAGPNGSQQPLQSASFEVSPPLVSNSPDAYFPEREAAFPIEPQKNNCPYRLPVFRPNIVPVTNRILAAIAQNELERPTSNSPVVLQPTSNGDMSQYWPRNNGQLFQYFLEHLRFIQGSDLSSSSSPDSQGPSRSFSPVLKPSINNSNDEISSLNQHILLTTKLEEMVTKNLKNIMDETGVETVEGGNNYKDVNIDVNNVNKEEVNPQEGTSGINRKGIPLEAVDVDNTCDPCHLRPCLRNHNPNISNLYFENDINLNRGVDASCENVAQSEYPEEDKSSRTEWTRPEKRRLGIVIRDFSRSMKTKELQHKKSNLLKKGRVIAQAIENKICKIDQEIMDVHKKTLRQVALPLNQIQEYDWVKVASVLNAKRSPEECRTHWKCFLHPSINNGEWTLIEARAMEIIAQRHNFRNWDDIAEELNTGRSGYQCYQFFRKYLCPHLELRGQCNHK